MKLKIDKIQLCCTRACQEACIHHSFLLPQRGQPNCPGSRWVMSLHCPHTLMWRGGWAPLTAEGGPQVQWVPTGWVLRLGS